MNNTKKNIIYSLILLVLIGIVYLWRSANQKPERHLILIQGKTMGVVAYNVKYIDQSQSNYKPAIDSLLQAFNQSLSTYIPDSEISLFNQDSSKLVFKSGFFYPVLTKSQEIYRNTASAFDPSVAPLINVWGFGKNKNTTPPDSAQVDSLKKLVGFTNIEFDKKQVTKKIPQAQLDFSAIAKGYAVDIVAKLLDEKGIENYMVEIGGELVCKGKNEAGKLWTIGVRNPRYKEAGEKEAISYVQVKNKAMASSGNYENFRVVEGQKFSHTISPFTGFPVEHSLLGATVFAQDCMSADAYATAFMVLGVEKSKQIVQKQDLEVLLVYADKNGKLQTFMSPSLEQYLVK